MQVRYSCVSAPSHVPFQVGPLRRQSVFLHDAFVLAQALELHPSSELRRAAKGQMVQVVSWRARKI